MTIERDNRFVDPSLVTFIFYQFRKVLCSPLIISVYHVEIANHYYVLAVNEYVALLSCKKTNKIRHVAKPNLICFVLVVKESVNDLVNLCS